MISPINEIASIDERPLPMNMLEKIQSRLEHLSKSERKVAEVILATPRRPFIQALPPWRWKPASASPRLTVSAAAGNPRFPGFQTASGTKPGARYALC
jgi:hypothetical protein